MKKFFFLIAVIVLATGCTSFIKNQKKESLDYTRELLFRFDEVKDGSLTQKELSEFLNEAHVTFNEFQDSVNEFQKNENIDEDNGKKYDRMIFIWNKIFDLALQKDKLQKSLKYLYVLNTILFSNLNDEEADRLRPYERTLIDFWINYSLALLDKEGDRDDPNNYCERYIISLLTEDEASAEDNLTLAREKAGTDRDFVYNQDIIDLYISLPDELFDIRMLMELLAVRGGSEPEDSAKIINENTPGEDEAKKVTEDAEEKRMHELVASLLREYFSDLLIDEDYYRERLKKAEEEAAREDQEFTYEEPNFDEELYKIKIDGKWGYINKRGSIVIKPRFDVKSVGAFSQQGIIIQNFNKYECIDLSTGNTLLSQSDLPYETMNNFSEGLAPVEKEGQWGFLNEAGDLIIEAQFDSVRGFSDGFAPVRRDNKWGYIDISGNIVIEPEYDDVQDFHDGLACVKMSNKYGYIDTTGNPVTGIHFENYRTCESGYPDLIPVQLNGLWGYIDRSGKVVIGITYNYCKDFSEKTAAVKIGNKWGYIDELGNITIEPEYQEADSFNEGYAWVRINGKWSFINRSGEMIIEPVYDNHGVFSQGLASVSLDWNAYGKNRYGYIDTEGNPVTELRYESCRDFSNDFGIAQLDGKYGVLDRKGKTSVDFLYDYIKGVSEGAVIVKLNGKYGYIDMNGNRLTSIDFDDCNSFVGEYARVFKDGKQGLLDKDFNYVITPDTYDFIEIYSENNAKCCITGKKGVVDHNGKIMVEPLYSQLYSFSDDFYVIGENGKYGLLRRETGEIVIEPRYDYFYKIWGSDFWIIKSGGKTGFLDSNGSVIVEPVFDSWSLFHEDIVTIEKEGMFGLFDLGGGKMVEEPRYITINRVAEGLASFEKKTKWRIEELEGGISRFDFDAEEGKEISLWGFFNEQGVVTVPPRYLKAYHYSEGLCFVKKVVGCSQDGMLYADGSFIDKDGTTVLDSWDLPENDTLWVEFINGFVKYEKAGRFGLISNGGEIISEPIYDSLDYSHQGIIIAEKENLFGLLDDSGEIVIDFQYDELRRFSDTIILGKKRGRWLFLDSRSGERLNDLRLENYSWSSGGYHRIMIDSKQGFINSLGKIIIQPEYKEINSFAEGLAAVKIDNKWGFIDETGYMIIAPRFDSVGSFSNGISTITIGNKIGYLNRRGEIIWEPTK